MNIRVKDVQKSLFCGSSPSLGCISIKFIHSPLFKWYGLTYEELVCLIAPRFNLLDDRLVRTDISVLISMALTEGYTPLNTVLERNYEYYSGGIRHHSSYSNGKRRSMKRINSFKRRWNATW